MTNYKIFKKGGYIVVTDLDEDVTLEDVATNVVVSRNVTEPEDSSTYTLTSPRIGTITLTPEQTYDENDIVYTAVTWEGWYQNNTGAITSAYPQPDYLMAVSQGLVPNAFSASFFGKGSTTTSYSTLWDSSHAVTHLTANTQLYASSSDASDVGTKITVYGVDENYNLAVRSAVLNGQNAVALSGTIMIVTAVQVSHTSVNVGDIYIAQTDTLSAGVPTTASKIKAKVLAGVGASRSALQVVPAGYSMYIRGIKPSTGKNEDCIFRFGVKLVGTATIYPSEISVYQSTPHIPVEPPYMLPEKTIFEIQGKVSTGTATAACTVDAIFVKN